MGQLTNYMAIFNSYVKLPEGNQQEEDLNGIYSWFMIAKLVNITPMPLWFMNLKTME